MAITDAFIDAVRSSNVRRIRIMMKDSLLVDPTFKEYKEMEIYSRHVNGLYDEHDGRTLEEDPSIWNDDYLSKMMVQIVGNFSHQRIEHLQKIVRHLHPVVLNQQTRVNSGRAASSESPNSTNRKSIAKTAYEIQKQRDAEKNRIRTTKVATSAVTGGVVIGTVAVASAGSFVAGAVVGAIVVGTVVYVVTDRR